MGERDRILIARLLRLMAQYLTTGNYHFHAAYNTVTTTQMPPGLLGLGCTSSYTAAETKMRRLK